MMAFPLSEVEVGIHMKRMEGATTGKCEIVGSNGNFFIRETRVVTSAKTGVEADVVTMHGRALGRHTHHKKDRRVIAGNVKEVT